MGQLVFVSSQKNRVWVRYFTSRMELGQNFLARFAMSKWHHINITRAIYWESLATSEAICAIHASKQNQGYHWLVEARYDFRQIPI